MADAEWPVIFPLEGTPPYDFKCARFEQNAFLHQRAWAEQREGFSVTYLAHLQGIAVGFMALAMDAITLQTSERPGGGSALVRFPAVKLAQLAVDERWEGRGIGKQLVALSAGMAIEIRSRIGCRYLTVDAKPDVVDWYASQEFKVNKEERKARAARAAAKGVRTDDLPLSMRLDLALFLEDLQDRFPRDFPRA